MPNIDIPGGRVVYDRGLSGIYIDDGGKQQAISPIAVRVFTVQAAEIERLKESLRSANRIINLLSMLIPEFETDEELKDLFEEWKSLGAKLEALGKPVSPGELRDFYIKRQAREGER